MPLNPVQNGGIASPVNGLRTDAPMGLGPPARNCFMVAKDANFVRGTKSADSYKVTAPPEVGSLNR